MGRRKPQKGGGGGGGDGARGTESVLEAAEEAVERGEKQLRMREPKKSRARFVEAVAAVRSAGLAGDRRGSLLLASAVGSILQIDAEEDIQVAWLGVGRAGAISTPEQRRQELIEADAALVAGQQAAVGAGAEEDELAHFCESRASVATLLAELLERGDADDAALEATGRAMDQLKEAGRLQLAGPVAGGSGAR